MTDFMTALSFSDGLNGLSFQEKENKFSKLSHRKIARTSFSPVIKFTPVLSFKKNKTFSPINVLLNSETGLDCLERFHLSTVHSKRATQSGSSLAVSIC